MHARPALLTRVWAVACETRSGTGCARALAREIVAFFASLALARLRMAVGTSGDIALFTLTEFIDVAQGALVAIGLVFALLADDTRCISIAVSANRPVAICWREITDLARITLGRTADRAVGAVGHLACRIDTCVVFDVQPEARRALLADQRVTHAFVTLVDSA